MILRILFFLLMASSVQAQFWALSETLGYSYGIDEAPNGAELFDSEKQMLQRIEQLDKQVVLDFEAFEKEANEALPPFPEAPIIDTPVNNTQAKLTEWIASDRSAKTIADWFLKADIVTFAKSKGIDHTGRELDLINRLILQLR